MTRVGDFIERHEDSIYRFGTPIMKLFGVTLALGVTVNLAYTAHELVTDGTEAAIDVLGEGIEAFATPETAIGLYGLHLVLMRERAQAERQDLG